MRSLAFVLLATPATAWEASREGPVCLLTHKMENAEIRVSHDAANAVPYAIDLKLEGGWQDGPIFAIRFDGPWPLTITTDQHALSNETLTVTDTGFGNVLDGIARNHVALAFTGETALVVPLAGAAPEVEAFKSCAANIGV